MTDLIDVVITSREEQGSDIAVLTLQLANKEPLPAFEAGAHIDVHIGDDLIRQYSLSNDPGDSQSYRIAVLKDPKSRGGSEAIFDNFSAGKTIQISAPRNHFPLAASSGKSVLLAGGIGITPMLAMAYELNAKGQPFELHYCLKTRASGAFVDELTNTFGPAVHFHCSREGEKKRIDLAQVLLPCDPDLHIYVCGPEVFLDAVIDFAKNAGYSSEQVHFEYFNAEVDLTGDAFEVYCEQSDKVVQVAPDQTIARALKEVGIRVDVSCEEGVCGTCITDVLEGTPEHRDHFLTDDEKADNDQMAVCCSRSRSARLVLDI